MKRPGPGPESRAIGRAATAGVFALAAIVALLLSVTTIAQSWAARVAASVEPRLAGEATLAVWARGLESPDAAAARAVEILGAEPRLGGVTALEPDPADRWMGRLIAGREIGGEPPRLISIGRGPGAAATGMLQRLNAAGIDAALDDHRGRGGPLERSALLGGAITVALEGLSCGIVLLVSIRAGGASIRRRLERVDLMIRLGARRGGIAATVSWPIGLAAFVGALVGCACCGGVLAAAILSPERLSLPDPLAVIDGVWPLVWPFILFPIAAGGASLGSRNALKRLEAFG